MSQGNAVRDLPAPFVRCILIPAVGGEIATELADAEQERLEFFMVSLPINAETGVIKGTSARLTELD